jgi:hypothetical protein
MKLLLLNVLMKPHYRYIWIGVHPARVFSFGCAKRIVVDTCHHMLGRLSSIIAKELLNDQKVVVVRARRSACPPVSSARESSDSVTSLMGARLSVTLPLAFG